VSRGCFTYDATTEEGEALKKEKKRKEKKKLSVSHKKNEHLLASWGDPNLYRRGRKSESLNGEGKPQTCREVRPNT